MIPVVAGWRYSELGFIFRPEPRAQAGVDNGLAWRCICDLARVGRLDPRTPVDKRMD